MAKAKIYMYGIEITKPHSKEMYAHNDKIAEEMKRNIISEIHLAYSQEMGTEEATNEDNGRLHKIASTFTGYQFGDEYDFDGMKDEAINILANISNWQLHEEYSYLCQKGIVPKLKQSMLGHKTPFFVYYTEDEVNGRSHINTITEIAGDRLRWTSCSDQDGNLWKEPYIKCSNKQEAESLEFPLKCNGVDAYVDCYEDDDGDGDYGKPIIRKIYSVKIKNY